MSRDVYLLMQDRVEKAVKASGQRKFRVDYSAYDSDDDDEPIDNLDQIAAQGKVVLIQESDDYFGGKGSRPYRSDILENPTWLQVAVCANAMIGKTRDEHHCFLEGIDMERKEGDVTVYRFLMGS